LVCGIGLRRQRKQGGRRKEVSYEEKARERGFVMSIPPGFAAYLKREHPEEFIEETPKKVIPFDKGVTRGDITVVEVRHSSNIARLEYNAKDRELTTTFVNGGCSIFAEVSSETFQRVAQPDIEFDYSVGKAHHALIVRPRKLR
jgi:hypothetical protein